MTPFGVDEGAGGARWLGARAPPTSALRQKHTTGRQAGGRVGGWVGLGCVRDHCNRCLDLSEEEGKKGEWGFEAGRGPAYMVTAPGLHTVQEDGRPGVWARQSCLSLMAWWGAAAAAGPCRQAVVWPQPDAILQAGGSQPGWVSNCAQLNLHKRRIVCRSHTPACWRT